ncbi:MAG: DNA translocase FtsK 4TM domain-containing protein, partial [Clostridia bacterium]
MAASKKKTPAKKNSGKKAAKPGTGKKTRRTGISSAGVAVILAVSAVVLFLLFICVSPKGEIAGAGILLQFIAKIFASLLGMARFALPFYLLLLAYAFFRTNNPEFRFTRYLVFSTILFLVFPVFFCIDQSLTTFGQFMKIAFEGDGGGVIGGIFAYGMLMFLTEPVSVVILVALGVFSVLMLTNFSWGAFLARRKEDLSKKRAAKKEAKALAEQESEEDAEDTLFDEPEEKV